MIEVTEKITVKLIQSMGGDYMVAAAARVSTTGDECLEFAKVEKQGEIAGLINFLMAHRHGTPFEHSSLTFYVQAPIFVWREWHRHRIGFSYNEESARYKQLKPLFWVPMKERPMVPAPDHSSARPHFVPADAVQFGTMIHTTIEAYDQAYKAYSSMIASGIAKEVARCVLPVGIYSSCWVTCNPRSLMAFLSLRVHDPDAKFISYPQQEIQQAAKMCEQMLQDGWPLTYAAFVKNGRVGP